MAAMPTGPTGAVPPSSSSTLAAQSHGRPGAGPGGGQTHAEGGRGGARAGSGGSPAQPAGGMSLPELTLRAILLGLVLSVIMGAANVYLGLKAGMTVSASIPAAVIGMLVLRAIFGGGSILEANQIQTTASAGESIAAGVIFTMPALVLIGAWQSFDMIVTTIIAFTGGLLGILFMIPMRRVFVVPKSDELKYPEGVACSAVLRAGDVEHGSPKDAMSVVKGTLLGALFKLGVSFVGIFKHTLEGAVAWGERFFYLGADMSPALVAVGMIVRLNVAILIFVGGAAAWLVGIPLLDGVAGSDSALDGAWTLWSTKIRYVGVGAMVVGGIHSIIKVRHGLVRAVREITAKRTALSHLEQTKQTPDTDRDIAPQTIVGLSVLATCLVAGVYFWLTGSATITAATTIIMLIMSFFFTAVASYIVGLVGNSNSPVSGMTITAVLFTGGLLLMFGFAGTEGMVATLGVAAIVCCAACTSGDVCNDLKTGQLVGASPRRQQIMQVAGVAVAALVMAPVLQLLHDNTPGGIGGRELAAPQASLFASLAQGFFGNGKLPWDMVWIGAACGVAVLIVDQILERKKSHFRAHVMPIAVGMYLPFGLALPILAGGLMAHMFAGKATGETADSKLRRGVLFASGAIAGESLMGVGLALLAAAGISKLSLGISPAAVTALTVLGGIAVLCAFYKGCKPKSADAP